MQRSRLTALLAGLALAGITALPAAASAPGVKTQVSADEMQTAVRSLGTLTLSAAHPNEARTATLKNGLKVTLDGHVERVAPDMNPPDTGGCGERTWSGYSHIKASVDISGVSQTLWDTYNRLKWTFDTCTHTVVSGNAYMDGTGPKPSYVNMTSSSLSNNKQDKTYFGDTYANYTMTVSGGPVPVGTTWNTSAHSEGDGYGNYTARAASTGKWTSQDNCWETNPSGCL